MRLLDNWLQHYIQYTAHLEAPNQMHFWTGVATIAGVLQRKVWIDQKSFHWVPNFYIVLVAPPGVVAKSTTAGVGMRLLREVPDVHMGPDACTWQALLDEMELAGREIMIGGELHPMSCVTLSLSEFGTLLDTENKQMIDVLTSLWDGAPTTFTKRTKTSGQNNIRNPWINMIACTTPSWIMHNFNMVTMSGGFVSRCMFIYADAKRRLVALPDEHVPPDFVKNRERLLNDLKDINEIKGQYQLTTDARQWINDWYYTHEKGKRNRPANEQMSGYLQRKQTHIMKLAMVIAAAKSNSLFITADDVREAEIVVTAQEDNMPKVFRGVGLNSMGNSNSDGLQVALDVADWVDKKGEASLAQTYKVFFRLPFPQFKQAISSAAQAGLFQIDTRGSDMWLVSNALAGARVSGSHHESQGTASETAARSSLPQSRIVRA